MDKKKAQRKQPTLLERIAGVFMDIPYGRAHESKHRGGRIRSLSTRAKRKKARKAARAARKITRPRYIRRS